MSFYEYIAEHYDLIFPFSLKKREFFRPVLEKVPGSLLDIGCATGEFVSFAGDLGWRCTGMDNDKNLLFLAQSKAEKKDQKTVLENIDMRHCGKMFKPGSFDLITSMGNTIVHLESNREVRDLAKNIFTILKSGGIFIGQVMNYGKILKNRSVNFPVMEKEGIRFSREYEFPEGKNRINFKMEIGYVSANKFFTGEVLLYPLTPDELKIILEGSGFEKIKYYGGFSGEKFSPDSDTLIFKAKKG